MATDMEKQTKLNELVNDLAKDPDILALVNSIETRIETTKDHYGDYMSELGKFDRVSRGVMALAMIKAGGNRAGIAWAIKLLN